MLEAPSSLFQCQMNREACTFYFKAKRQCYTLVWNIIPYPWKTGPLKLKSRRLPVKVCVSHLVEKSEFYPSSAEKLVFVTTFTSLLGRIKGKGDGFIEKLKAEATMERNDFASLMEGMEDQADDEKCYPMLDVLAYLLPPLPGSRSSVQ